MKDRWNIFIVYYNSLLPECLSRFRFVSFRYIGKKITEGLASLFDFLRGNAFIIAGIAAALLFRAEIEQIGYCYISEPLMLSDRPAPIAWYIAAGLIALWHFYKCINRSVYSLRNFIIAAFIAGTYGYYRFWNISPYSFMYLQDFSAIAYLDLILLYFGGTALFATNNFVCIRIKRACNCLRKLLKSTSPHEGFYYDAPVSKREISRDALGRQKYAEQLARQLLKTKSGEQAFAMGLVGEWGSGKTSFWRQMRHSLESGKEGTIPVIVEYSPWQNHGAETIIKDFFAALSNKLAPYDSGMERIIERYTALLLSQDESAAGKLLKPLRSLLDALPTAQDEFDRINRRLKLIGRQVVIFIDDLDRLSRAEIIEVIRLIRNTANFANLIFVVAYDRSYIIKAIAEFNDYNKEAFLEKIFQLEIPLPRYEDVRIKEHISALLKPHLECEDWKIIHNQLFPSSPVFGEIIESIDVRVIKTLREATRFANSLISIYQSLKDDTLIKDLFYTELLKVKYPGVYQLVFDGENRFIDYINKGSYKGIPWDIYKLSYNENLYYKNDRKLNKAELNYEKEESLYIERFLREHYEYYNISNDDVTDAVYLLEQIFNDINGKSLTLKSIVFPSSFHRYCFNRLSVIDVPTNDFNKVRNNVLDSNPNSENRFSELKDLIDKWLSNKVSIDSIAAHLFLYEDSKSINDFKSMTFARFYFLLRRGVKNTPALYAHLGGEESIFRIIPEAKALIPDLLKKIIDEFKGEVLLNYVFVNLFFYSLTKNCSDGFPYSEKERKDNLTVFLNKFDFKNAMAIFRNQKYSIDGDFEKIKVFRKEYIIELIRNDPNKYFNGTIVQKDVKSFIYIIDEYIIFSIFSNLEGYKTFLEEHHYTDTEIGKQYEIFLDKLINKERVDTYPLQRD